MVPYQCPKVLRSLRPVVCTRRNNDQSPRHRRKDSSKSLGGGERLTEWHLGEKVVHNMIVRYIMEEKTALPAQKIPVNGACCTALEGPLALTEMGQLRISMVEICDHDKLTGFAFSMGGTWTRA